MSASGSCSSCAFSLREGSFGELGLICGHPRSCYSDVVTFFLCHLYQPANDEDVPRDEIDEGFDSGGVR